MPNAASARRRLFLHNASALPQGPFPSEASARFDVGQQIEHRVFGYRGVIYDVDASFQGSEDRYRAVTRNPPPRDVPWYHVLIDGETRTAYVSEGNLRPDPEPQRPVEHPLLSTLFDRRTECGYRINPGPN
ncbi:MAG: heat shock protein HspQ [Acidobacteriota bacterium]